MVSSLTPEGSKEPTSLDPGCQDPLSKPVLLNMLPLTELCGSGAVSRGNFLQFSTYRDRGSTANVAVVFPKVPETQAESGRQFKKQWD